MKFKNKETGDDTQMLRPILKKMKATVLQTTLEGLSGSAALFSKTGQVMQVKEGKYITAGNASQLSDGASAAVVMETKELRKNEGLHAAWRSIGVWLSLERIRMKWASALFTRCRGFSKKRA